MSDDFLPREEYLFQARLTGRVEIDGVPVYSAEELDVQPSDGSLESFLPARTLTGVRELNDAAVDVEGQPLVWVRLRGFTAAGPVYEFDAGGLRFVGAVSLARVTDPDPDAGGRYAAVLATLDPDDGTPADGDEVLLLSPDGEDLLEGRYYEVVYQGRDADDEPVWAAGAGRPVLARVTDGTPDGDGLYAAVLTVWDGATWSDGAEVLLLPANDEELAEGERYQATFQSRDEDSPAVWAAAPGSGAIGDASYTQRGAVSLEGQTFRGSKAVKDGIGDVEAEAAAEIHLTVGSVDPTAVVSSQTFQGGVTEDAPDGCSVRSYLVGTGGSWTDVGGHSGLGGAYAPYNVGVVGADVLVYPGSTVYGVELVLDPFGSRVVVQGTGTPAVVCPQYAWYPNGGSLDDREDGQTGTLSDGSSVKGGIITDIDDGSGFFTGTVP